MKDNVGLFAGIALFAFAGLLHMMNDRIDELETANKELRVMLAAAQQEGE